MAARKASALSRLYTGTGAFDIVGRRKAWYVAVWSFVNGISRGNRWASFVAHDLVGAIDLETGQPPAQPATTDCQT